MPKKKVCKNCRYFVTENECPVCKGTDLATSWKGRIIVIDAGKSEIAEKMGIKVKGEYALKVK